VKNLISEIRCLLDRIEITGQYGNEIHKSDSAQTTRILRETAVQLTQAEAALAGTRELYRDLAAEHDTTRRERNRYREIIGEIYRHLKPTIRAGYERRVEAWLAEVGR